MQLKEYLAEHVRNTKSSETLTIHVVSTYPKSFSKDSLTLNSQHLILLASPKSFVFACESSHYTFGDKNIVYINKVDSTASSLAKSLLQAYLQHCLLTLGDRVFIDVYARAQPEYLFPKSSKNHSKHILSERSLIKWWKATLDTLTSPSSSPLKSHYFVPNEELSTLRDFAVNNSLNWTYGFPYNSNADASKVIPKFPDDARTKVLEMVGGDGGDFTSVQDFSELIGCMGECASGRLSGFLSVEKTDQGGVNVLSGKPDLGVEPTEFKSLIDLMMRQDYSTYSLAEKSSKTILNALTQLKNVVKVEISPSVSVLGTVAGIDNSKKTISNINGLVKPNNLQGLMKKKGDLKRKIEVEDVKISKK